MAHPARGLNRDPYIRAQVLVLGAWRDVTIVRGSRTICGLTPVGLRGYAIDPACFQARRLLGSARYVRTLTDDEGRPLCIVDEACR